MFAQVSQALRHRVVVMVNQSEKCEILIAVVGHHVNAIFTQSRKDSKGYCLCDFA
jgi:hypothetical protein